MTTIQAFDKCRTKGVHLYAETVAGIGFIKAAEGQAMVLRGLSAANVGYSSLDEMQIIEAHRGQGRTRDLPPPKAH